MFGFFRNDSEPIEVKSNGEKRSREDVDAQDFALLCEIYQNNAGYMWDNFDSVFIDKVLKETNLIKTEQNKQLTSDKNDLSNFKEDIKGQEELDKKFGNLKNF